MATSFRRRTGTIMQQIVEEILEAYHAEGPTGDPLGNEDLLTEICMETVGTVGSDIHLNILAAAEYTSENLCQEFGRDALDLGSALMMAAEGYVHSEVEKRLEAEAEAEVSHHEHVLGSRRSTVRHGEPEWTFTITVPVGARYEIDNLDSKLERAALQLAGKKVDCVGGGSAVGKRRKEYEYSLYVRDRSAEAVAKLGKMMAHELYLFLKKNWNESILPGDVSFIGPYLAED